MLQPGGAETRTCPMTGGCSVPHPVIVLVSKLKGHALCSASLPAPASVSMETNQDDQMVNTEIRLIIFFAAKDGEALYSQEKQDRELTVSQIMNSLLPNSD